MKLADDIKYALWKNEEPDNAIDLLKFDHRNVNAMFAECLKAEDSGQRQELAQQIVAALALHAAAEEKLIYPILGLQDDEMMREALEEHHIMKLSLSEIFSLSGAEENFKAKVKVLSEIVNTHVLEEEAQMLPKVQHSDFDMQELAEKIKELKESLKGDIQALISASQTSTPTADGKARRAAAGPAKKASNAVAKSTGKAGVKATGKATGKSGVKSTGKSSKKKTGTKTKVKSTSPKSTPTVSKKGTKKSTAKAAKVAKPTAADKTKKVASRTRVGSKTSSNKRKSAA